MEGLELSAIFAPKSLVVGRDFLEDQGEFENNFTVRTVNYIIRRVKFANDILRPGELGPQKNLFIVESLIY